MRQVILLSYLWKSSRSCRRWGSRITSERRPPATPQARSGRGVCENLPRGGKIRLNKSSEHHNTSIISESQQEELKQSQVHRSFFGLQKMNSDWLPLLKNNYCALVKWVRLFTIGAPSTRLSGNKVKDSMSQNRRFELHLNGQLGGSRNKWLNYGFTAPWLPSCR